MVAAMESEAVALDAMDPRAAMDPRFRVTRYAENEKEALNFTADLLEAEGWCQGIGRAEPSARCMSIALAEVVGCYDLEGDLWSPLRRRASGLWNDTAALLLKAINLDPVKGEQSYGSIVTWNDEPGRTEDDVVNLLRHVASTL